MTFEEMGLHAAVLKALADAGYTEPTPVQAQAIPVALTGRDLMVSSQTGSGKTAAFMLPAIHKLASQETASPQKDRHSDNQNVRRPRFVAAQPKMLVLTPTRELALQVTTATDKYGVHLRRLRAVSILGGMPYPKQMQLLSRNPEILVATPGRLIDHMNSGKIDFSQLQILVLDEADRMLDMGFVDDIETIIAATPDSRQTMLFSATLDGEIGRMATRITRDPKIISIAGSQTRHENITQKVHFVDDMAHKNRLLDHLLRDTDIDQAVIFTATKRDADSIATQLNQTGFSAAPLHGDMHQGARNRTLSALRSGRVRILVATDVAARGIDVPGITHVFNYDLPKFPEDYVHRIGRTGRAGRHGIAVSLVNHAEGIHIKRIERFTKQMIPVDVVPGHEPQRQPSFRGAKPAGGRASQNKRWQGKSRNDSSYPNREHSGAHSTPRSEGIKTNRAAIADKRPNNFAGKADYPVRTNTTNNDTRRRVAQPSGSSAHAHPGSNNIVRRSWSGR